MTIEKLASIIAAGTNQKMSESQIVLKIVSLTNVNLKRAIAGYIQLREKGLINSFVDRATIGTIDKLLKNDKLMNAVQQLDGVPINLHISAPIITDRKPSSYLPDEIIPGVKMTRRELSDWISTSTASRYRIR